MGRLASWGLRLLRRMQESRLREASDLRLMISSGIVRMAWKERSRLTRLVKARMELGKPERMQKSVIDPEIQK